jgi:hypothetical protein
MSDYSKYLEGVDDVQPTFGFSNDPLPKGQYPFVVKAIQDQGESPNGQPFAKVQLGVLEGPYKGRVVFETIYFGAAETKGVLDGDKFVRVARTPEEWKKANTAALGRCQGWIKALGIAHGDDKSDPFAYFRVGSWVGCQIMCELGVKNDQNNVTAFCTIDDPKKGISVWREKVLPAQEKRVAGGVAATGAATTL